MTVLLPTCRCSLAASKIVPASLKSIRTYVLCVSEFKFLTAPESEKIPRKLHRTDGKLARFPSTHRPGCFPMTEIPCTNWDSPG